MTTINRVHTLATIAADAETTKRTVQRWLSKSGDIGVLDGDTRYFSDSERDILLSHQSKRKPTDITPTDTSVTPTEITVIEGNHQQTLANIELDTQFDLGTLRSPLTIVESYQDPLAMAQQILTQNSQIVGAMSTDLEQRQAKLNQANQALALVEQSNQNLMAQAQQYQIESTVQGALLNQATTQLQQKIQLQQNLGKPAGTPSEQSQH